MMSSLRGSSIEISLELLEELSAEQSVYDVPTFCFVIVENTYGRQVGTISLKRGYNDNIYYVGNIGYEIYPEYRGNHYAYKACMLIIELAVSLGMKELYITCDPDNYASIKTCELLGSKRLGTVNAPLDSEVYKLGIREKVRYKLNLSD